MHKVIMRETVYFSDVESLYRKLEVLDPVYRAAARLVDFSVDHEVTFGGQDHLYAQMIFEAEIDASP